MAIQHTPWNPSMPDRRSGRERRAYARGGRRRADWPQDAQSTTCPRCTSRELHFIDATPAEYFWACHTCRHAWSMGRGVLLAG